MNKSNGDKKSKRKNLSECEFKRGRGKGKCKRKNLVKCPVYMFGFTFIMPAKLSVCLPVATVVTVVSCCNTFTFSSPE